MSWSILLLICVGLAVVIPPIRWRVISKRSEDDEEEFETISSLNKKIIDEALREENAEADVTFVDQSACAALVKGLSKLLIVDKFGALSEYDLRDIASVEVMDRSEAYKHAFEMYCRFEGAEGEVSDRYPIREVWKGEREYDRFVGEMVYGMKLVLKDGTEKAHAFYRGTEPGGEYWENNIAGLTRFVDELRPLCG